MDVSATAAPGPAKARFVSMDQFRGLTILLMFAVHYSGPNWGINPRPVLGHNHYYLSVGDLAFPWFHFAAGFALRLSLLRRLDRDGSWAAYRRTVRRCLLLILLGDLPALLGGWHVSHWGPEQGTDLQAQIATRAITGMATDLSSLVTTVTRPEQARWRRVCVVKFSDTSNSQLQKGTDHEAP